MILNNNTIINTIYLKQSSFFSHYLPNKMCISHIHLAFNKIFVINLNTHKISKYIYDYLLINIKYLHILIYS